MDSISEDRGLALLTDDDLNILSLGISTAGIAEIRMAQQNPKRHIIATTINKNGMIFTKNLIKQHGITEQQIELKIEDTTKAFPYKESSFDFVYSRLCLHYIDDTQMKFALNEIKRVLKPNKKAFIVVQSKESLSKIPNPIFIKESGMTRYINVVNGIEEIRYRRFYSQDDFKEIIKDTGLKILSICEYMELTCSDYERQIPSSKPSGMLEVVLENSNL